MHRSTPPFIIGTALGAVCLVCTLLGYHLAAVIIGCAGFFPSSLAVKSGGGNRAMYTHFIVAIIFGYSIYPSLGHFIIPVSILMLAIMPCIRPIFYKNIGSYQFMFAEALTYLISVSLFVIGNIYYGATWVEWTFPGLVFLFGLFLVSVFTLEKQENQIEDKRLFWGEARG